MRPLGFYALGLPLRFGPSPNCLVLEFGECIETLRLVLQTPAAAQRQHMHKEPKFSWGIPEIVVCRIDTEKTYMYIHIHIYIYYIHIYIYSVIQYLPYTVHSIPYLDHSCGLLGLCPALARLNALGSPGSSRAKPARGGAVSARLPEPWHSLTGLMLRNLN